MSKEYSCAELAKCKGHRTAIRGKVTKIIKNAMRLVKQDVRKLSLSALQDARDEQKIQWAEEL